MTCAAFLDGIGRLFDIETARPLLQNEMFLEHVSLLLIIRIAALVLIRRIVLLVSTQSLHALVCLIHRSLDCVVCLVYRRTLQSKSTGFRVNANYVIPELCLLNDLYERNLVQAIVGSELLLS